MKIYKPNNKKNLYTYVAVIICLMIAGIPFFKSWLWIFSFSILLSFPVIRTILKNKKSKDIIFAREQLYGLMEYLYTSVSAGLIISEGICNSLFKLQTLFGENSMSVKGVKRFRSEEKLGIPLNERLVNLAKNFPCPESLPLFQLISTADLYGRDLSQILQRSYTMLSGVLSVSKDISSDVAQKRAESSIMSLMPFLVAWSLYLSTPSYIQSALLFPIGRFIYSVAFIISVLSYCIGTQIVSHSISDIKSKTGKSPFFISLTEIIYNSSSPLIIKLYSSVKKLENIIPISLIHKRYRDLEYIKPGENDHAGKYTLSVILIVLIVLILSIPSILFLHTGVFPWIIIFFSLLIFNDRDIYSKAHSKSNLFALAFPGFISLLSTLLQSGIPTGRAIRISLDSYLESSINLSKELSWLSSSLIAGIPVEEALEGLASRIRSNEISSALLLIAQYYKNGNSKSLDLLNLQCSICWSASRRVSKKQLEDSALKLLFPMMLQLVCVGVLAVAPSLFSSGFI